MEWYYLTTDEVEVEGSSITVERPQRFTLTTAHYPDHNPANCDRSNLVALCATCHTQLDINPSSLAIKRQRKLEEQGQLNLLKVLDWNPESTVPCGPPAWHPAKSKWQSNHDGHLDPLRSPGHSQGGAHG